MTRVQRATHREATPSKATTRPRKTPRPAVETFTKVPHAYDELITRRCLAPGNVDRDILYLIMRLTIGWQRDKAKISRRQFARFAGVSDLKYIGQRLEYLAKDIIGRETSKACSAPLYWCKFENWSTAPPYEPKPGDPPAPDDEDDDEDDEQDDEQDDEEGQAEDTTPEPAPARITLEPGRRKCYALPQQPYEKIHYTVKGPYPVQVSTRTNPGGILALTITAKANTQRNTKRLHPPSLTISAAAENTATVGVQTPSLSDPLEQIQRLTAIGNAITQLCEKFLQRAIDAADSADQELITNCAAALHASVPIDTFEQYCTRELISMQKRGKTLHPRILVSLAEQASADHWKRSRNRARHATAAAGEPAPKHADNADNADSAARRPAAMPCSRCQGRKNIKPAKWWTKGNDYGPHPIPCPDCNGTGRAQTEAA